MCRVRDGTYENIPNGIEHPDPLVAANVMIGLARVAIYLLSNQIRRLEQDFLAGGGLRERMTRARLEARGATWGLCNA